MCYLKEKHKKELIAKYKKESNSILSDYCRSIITKEVYDERMIELNLKYGVR